MGPLAVGFGVVIGICAYRLVAKPIIDGLEEKWAEESRREQAIRDEFDRKKRKAKKKK
ncbi:MAG: hypothetical protein MUC28_03285 [Planctomycetes bacterium]|jgi:hypothetical protein|nr:hypothetical protein [Planctomycetota bacterium]